MQPKNPADLGNTANLKAPTVQKLPDSWKRFLSDNRAVAAIEFAFIVPILMCLYLGSMELSQAIETNKKVGRIASMVGDLVTQQSNVTADMLAGIMKIGAATIQPYNRSDATITVTAIDIPANPSKPTEEVWQRTMAANGSTSGSMARVPPNPPVPASLDVDGSFLIRVTAQLPYEFVLTYSEKSAGTFGLSQYWNSISMSETYYLRPRMSNSIPCSDCGS